jgi:hypothetical protein
MILVVGNEKVPQLPPQYARIPLQGQGRLEQDHHNFAIPSRPDQTDEDQPTRWEPYKGRQDGSSNDHGCPVSREDAEAVSAAMSPDDPPQRS